MIIVIRVCLAQCGHLVRAVIRIKTVSLASPAQPTLTLIGNQDSTDHNYVLVEWHYPEYSATSHDFLFLAIKKFLTFQTSTWKVHICI